jgi:Mg/Co/Ni transporter MgtE
MSIRMNERVKMMWREFLFGVVCGGTMMAILIEAMMQGH